MRYLRRTTVVAVGLVGLGSALVGCGGEPAVCEDVDALRTSVQNLQDVQIGEGALSALSTDLQQIESDLDQLREDTSEEYSTEIDAVQAETDALRESLQAAGAEPSATSFSEVAGDVQALVSSMTDLDNAVDETCG
jgi:hypothetical protein